MGRAMTAIRRMNQLSLLAIRADELAERVRSG
jgi:hypothetical protein